MLRSRIANGHFVFGLQPQSEPTEGYPPLHTQDWKHIGKWCFVRKVVRGTDSSNRLEMLFTAMRASPLETRLKLMVSMSNHTTCAAGGERPDRYQYRVYLDGAGVCQLCRPCALSLFHVGRYSARQAFQAFAEEGTVPPEIFTHHYGVTRFPEDYWALVKSLVETLFCFSPSHYRQCRSQDDTEVKYVTQLDGSLTSLRQVHSAVCDELRRRERMVMSLTTFDDKWEVLFPNVHLQRPLKDVCDTCCEIELLRNKLLAAHSGVEEADLRWKTHRDVVDPQLARVKDLLVLGKQISDKLHLFIAADAGQHRAIPKPVHQPNCTFWKQAWFEYVYIVYTCVGGLEDYWYFFWDETVCSQNVSGALSCVSRVIAELKSRHADMFARITSVSIASDNCAREMKNQYNVLFGLNLRMEYQHIREIVHVFYPRGHSYMPCDRACGWLEKRGMNCTISGLHQWAAVAMGLRYHRRPHEVAAEDRERPPETTPFVTTMTADTILDWPTFLHQFGEINPQLHMSDAQSVFHLAEIGTVRVAFLKEGNVETAETRLYKTEAQKSRVFVKVGVREKLPEGVSIAPLQPLHQGPQYTDCFMRKKLKDLRTLNKLLTRETNEEVQRLLDLPEPAVHANEGEPDQ